MQHFFADINKAVADLNWQPEYDLLSGLKDSLLADYLANQRQDVEVDFSLDEEILAAT